MIVLVLQEKGLIQIIVKLRAVKKNCACFYYPPNVLLRGTKYCAPKQLCSNTLKKNELKFYISLKENKLACFTNS